MWAASQSGPPGDARGGRTLRLSLIAFACAIAVLAAGTWHYRQFMADDAFISLRYADRLLHGHGLTWNDGEVVEGYTNLLWVLGCALLGRLGLDLVWVARALGLLGTTAAIAAVIWVYPAHTIRGALPGFAGALALALSGPIVVWVVRVEGSGGAVNLVVRGTDTGAGVHVREIVLERLEPRSTRSTFRGTQPTDTHG